jgi:hypothetical protein
MENNTIVIEGYMNDGIDRVYSWGSVDEALESGRFEYLDGMYDEDDEDSLNPDDLENCESVEELIEMVGYPFEVYEGDLKELLKSPHVKFDLD